MVQVIGRYPVSGVIGAGGFGTVYAGSDPDTGDAVAIKVLDWPDQDWRRAMFRHEATALLAIDHPNVVRVREVIDQPGLAALVTDLIEGASLRALLTHAGPLTGPQALGVLAGALDGLAAVHAVGLVHADLKPENILVDRSGTSRLIDFGLAAPPGPLAGPDTWIGTPAYLAPERVLGTFQDARTDLYSTAVVLFELLCGRIPIQGPDALATAQLQVTQPAPDPAAYVRDLSPALAELIRVNLAKNPAQRHQNAPAFARSLRHAASTSYGPGWVLAGALSGTVGAALGAVPAVLGMLGSAPLAASGLGAAGLVGAGAAGAAGAHAAAGGAGAGAAGGSSAAATTVTTTATVGGAKAAIVAGVVAVAAVGGGGAAYVATHQSHPAAPAAVHPVLLGGYVGTDQHTDSYGNNVTVTQARLVRNDGSTLTIPGTLSVGSSGYTDDVHLTTSADGRWILASSTSTDYGSGTTSYRSRFSLISTTAPDERLIGTCACRPPVVTPHGDVLAVTGDLHLLRYDVTDQGLTARPPIPLSSPQLHDDPFFGLAAASDTTLYVDSSRGIQSSVLGVDLGTGAVSTVARPADNGLYPAALSPDGRYLAMTTTYGGTGCSSQLLYVVDLTTGRASHLVGPDRAGEAQSVTFQGDQLVVGWSHVIDAETCPRSPAQIFTTPTADLPRLAGESTTGAVWTPAAPAGVVWRAPSHDGRTLTLTSHQQYGQLPGTLAVDGRSIATDVASVVATTTIAPGTATSTVPSTASAPVTTDPASISGSVDGAGRVDGLHGAAPDFLAFLADLGRTQYAQEQGTGCPGTTSPSTTQVRVQAYDSRGFALGDAGFCSGYLAVWERLGGTWTEVLGTQDGWSCDDLAWAHIPSRLIAYRGKATCWDAASGSERTYRQA